MVAASFAVPTTQPTAVTSAGILVTVPLTAGQQGMQVTRLICVPKTATNPLGCTYFDAVFTNASTAVASIDDPQRRIAKFVDVPATIGVDASGIYKSEGADGDGNIYVRIKPHPDLGAAIAVTDFNVRIEFN